MKSSPLLCLVPLALLACSGPTASPGGPGSAESAGGLTETIEIDLGGGPTPVEVPVVPQPGADPQIAAPGGGSDPIGRPELAPPPRPSVGASSGSGVALSKMVRLVVLHTNDTHGQVLPRDAFWTQEEGDDSGGIVRLGAEIARQRELAASEGAEVLLLDGGDWFQGTPEGATDAGVPYVSMLTSFGYDAMAVGNHDFDLGLRAFDHLLTEARPPVLAANVFLGPERDAARPDWAEPFRIVERAGLEIALIGLVTTSTPVISSPETRTLDFRDPVRVLGEILTELPATVDLAIPVGHLGVEVDRELALAYPELPLIVGGHSHSFLRNGLRQDDTLIVQSGAKASNLGRVELELLRSSGEVLSANARLIELDSDPEPRLIDPAVVAVADQLVAASAESMDEVVGTITEIGATEKPFHSLALGSWVADAMRRRMRADVGLHNRGGVRKALEVGPVTRRDLYEVLPFDNTVVSFDLSGVELRAVLEGALDGRERSRIDVSGVQLQVDMDSKGRAIFIGARVGGSPLDPEGIYRIATNSYLAQGGDAVFDLGEEPRFEDSGSLIREVVEAELVEAGELALPTDDRYLRGRGVRGK